MDKTKRSTPEMEGIDEATDTAGVAQVRQPYLAPKLIFYGEITVLTLGKGATDSDGLGGSGPL